MITRLAPTPSGFLHAGNAVNFVLVHWLAAQSGGTVILRIDDMDVDRYRPEFVDDIFRVLDWLGIEWHDGPTTRDDFERNHSLRLKADYYWAEVERLLLTGSSDVVYACACSRSMLRAAGSQTCVSDCRNAAREPVVGRTALRARVAPGTVITVDGDGIDLGKAMGDFVVWRRDGLASYQLASLIEDRDHGVDVIVRGADLRDSTAAQLWLAPYVDAATVGRATFVHHGLLTDSGGAKLSKSSLRSGPLERTRENRERIHAAARRLAAPAGVPVP